jgi:threonine dehydrogenase-like Zn-dependent dehydrogenase
VVIGGGPIGILIALVAREVGAQVLVSEINPARLELLRSLGIETVNPRETDFEKAVMVRTNGLGAEVVFEVTASAAGAEVMTKLPCIRGRIVLVGIFSAPTPVNLFPFFWKEIKLFGARVYEACDFDEAIHLMADGKLPLRPLISRVAALEQVGEAFAEIDAGPNIVKTLVQCSPEVK